LRVVDLWRDPRTLIPEITINALLSATVDLDNDLEEVMLYAQLEPPAERVA
jgi:hypothetical protein